MNGQHFAICIYVARKSPGKGRKWYFQGSIFQNFQGATPNPLEARGALDLRSWKK